MFLDDYKRWMDTDLEDPALEAELESIEGNEEEIKDRFAVALKFGTYIQWIAAAAKLLQLCPTL